MVNLNKRTQEQLSKVSVAKLDEFDEVTLTYHIKRYTEFHYEENNCYLVRLNDILLRQDGLPLLVTNMNRNTFPREKYLKVDVLKSVGDMIKVIALGYSIDTAKDLNYTWEGWLPTQHIEMLERL